jgi:hypothetical protein
MFSMLASADVAPVLSVESQDPELDHWTQFRDFIGWCKTEMNTAHFDMMACALYSDTNWKYVIDTLTTQTGVTVRASTDNTGAATQGGNWFLESHTGVNLKGVYFTELIEEYRGVLFLRPRYKREYPTKGFATGSVEAWGFVSYGGSTPGNVTDGVVSIYSSTAAFAALKTDGSIVTWGLGAHGGSYSGLTGVVAVYSTYAAFAALKANGSVVTWGDSSSGGYSGYYGITGGVVSIYSTSNAFAALKTNGSVQAWGLGTHGGTDPGITGGVVSIYSTNGAFAALKTDGSVQTWGNSNEGGTNPGITGGVVSIYSTDQAFAALKSDGSVVTWGNSGSGGLNPGITGGVVSIYSTDSAFAALKADGSVQAWGGSANGGLLSPGITGGVVSIYSTQGAFAALKTDGSVVAWGNSFYGGLLSPGITGGVVSIYSTNAAFAALKTDGSVVAWGSSGYGGSSPGITGGVVSIYSTGLAFAALKTNGSVVAWGDYNGVYLTSGITGGVVAVYSAAAAFAALKTTASTFDLSFSYYRNIDRYDILRKKENRRRVNLTTLNNNVFTLSAARDLQSFNPTMPTDKVLRVIVPTYVSSSYSITSTATIPSGVGSVIIACDEGEPVTISGSTYVNYGSYVYKRETNNTYTKLTTTQIVSGTAYMMYGGDGINSSGIALVVPTFVVATPKVYGDASFAITTRPTTSSNGAITYTSSNTAVATIDSAGDWINIVSPGTATIIATQAADGEYASFTITSNVLTVNKITPTLALVGVASTVAKNLSDAPFTVAASSASPGLITYTSSNTAVATVGLTTGLVTLLSSGSVTITAAQASTAFYSAPASVTCAIIVGAVESLAGTTVTTSLANRNFTGASFANTVLTNISLAGATLTGVNFSGATITGANFTNANISGATNLPAFSTTQKLQLLRNANNAAISAVQITTLLSGTELNAAITTPIPDIEGATFVVKAPAYDASGVKVVTVTTVDVSNNASLYIPMNSGETVKVNGVTYTFDGSSVLNASGAAVTFILVVGKPFRLYTGSIVGLNVVDELNNITISGYGLYDVLSGLFVFKN